MTDEDFRYWKQWVERHVEGYDEIARAVFIEGFFDGMPKETIFTTTQVSEILALRRPEKEKHATQSPARREAH